MGSYSSTLLYLSRIAPLWPTGGPDAERTDSIRGQAEYLVTLAAIPQEIIFPPDLGTAQEGSVGYVVALAVDIPVAVVGHQTVGTALGRQILRRRTLVDGHLLKLSVTVGNERRERAGTRKKSI